MGENSARVRADLFVMKVLLLALATWSTTAWGLQPPLLRLPSTCRRSISHHPSTTLQHRSHSEEEEQIGVPAATPPSHDPSTARVHQKAFRQLLERILAVKDPQHLPSLLTKHVDLILALDGQDGVEVLKSILEDAQKEGLDDVEIRRLEEAMEMTLAFAEDFVNTASSLDDQNKKLLGKIIRTMSNKDIPARQREEDLEALFAEERPNFSSGFLRHLDGECRTIEKSLDSKPDAANTLQMLRVIHTRVLEEVGKDLGEGAQVLHQLIGYDDDAERTAVLEAGLMVRGKDFAVELQSLTAEALEGLARVPGEGADSNLIRIVDSMHQVIRAYVAREEEESSFQ